MGGGGGLGGGGGGWGWWGGGQGGCEHNVGGTGDVGYEGCEPRIEGIVQCTNQRTNGPVNAHLMSCPSENFFFFGGGGGGGGHRVDVNKVFVKIKKKKKIGWVVLRGGGGGGVRVDVNEELKFL